MASVVSQRYALSLFDAAQEEKLEDGILDDLAGLDSLMEENPDFLKLLGSPMVEKRERIQIIDNVFGKALEEYTLSFLKILVEAGRITLLREMVAEYRRLFQESRNIQAVTVTTAVGMTGKQLESLKARLEKAMGKTILLSAQVKPEILGGVILDLGNQQVDSSVKSRLEAVREQLAASAG